MKRRWITILATAGFLFLGIQGVCRETVKRPVVRFIDFYIAAEEAQKPPSLFERIAYGLALAASPDPSDKTVQR